jgi:RNA polymerase sigma-70 factor, ECF subfamily
MIARIEQDQPPQTGPAAWLQAHGDVMWRYAMGRIHNAELAEELIQETLTAALEARTRFRGECSERTWLLSILRRKMVDALRKRGREVAIGGGNGAATGRVKPEGGDAFTSMFDERGRWRFDPGPGPEETALDSPEFMADFERCLSKMPAGLAEAFVMREVRGSASEAICEALQITMDNLWVRLHRARVLLRKCLSPRWAPVRKERC